MATLSNQNLMGRLVYVREDREAEPRFNNPGASRGGFDGGMGRGGFGGPMGGPGYSGGMHGGAGGGGRQVYVANVCTLRSLVQRIQLTAAASLQRRLARPEGLVPPGW